MKKIIYGISLLLLTSCGSSKLNDRIVKVDPGMTKDQVIDLLGTPGDRQFMDAFEAWQYCSSSVVNNNKHYIVWFEDGYVSGLTSFNEPASPQCSESFKPINWGNRPHPAMGKPHHRPPGKGKPNKPHHRP